MHVRHPSNRTRAASRRTPSPRLVPALAAACLAVGLVGCTGSTDDQDPPSSAAETTVTDDAETTGTEDAETTDTEDASDAPSASDQATSDDDGTDEATSGSESEGSESESSESEGSESESSESEGSESESSESEGSGSEGSGSENLFEGSWGFGHDSKTMSAEDLADLLEEEAESRGPEEMSLEVVCDDGFDLDAGDWSASCTAIGDEGHESPWSIVADPAGPGVEVTVENTD